MASPTPGSSPAGRPANHLAGQKSPYLLQHQHNPVDWYPWGAQAFEKARQENKPIFLSIGYSTCHWCHVMERESFEDERLAAFLNAHFVSIKVDREERPDVDRIYMTFIQATSAQGGWPLNVFLTPELKPFYGGTYYAPEPRHGRPGLGQVLGRIQELWSTRREELVQSAGQMHQRLRDSLASAPALEQAPSLEALHKGASVLKQSYDPEHGGFGTAPKFPQPSQPRFLLRYAQRFHDGQARDMVLHTCQHMAAGGIHDQLGGGFARYSVDGAWLVPHFEKMLYDNAQLALLYREAWLVSGDSAYAAVMGDILEYELRDMRAAEGGFYSAEDADSEGHEGKFYCWSIEELRSLLSAEEFELAQRYYGITAQGNFADHSHPYPLVGQNVLSVAEAHLSQAEEMLLARLKQKLLAARDKRVRPHRDDKVLTAWNGLMLAALAQASAVPGGERWRAPAEQTLEFLKTHLWEPASKTLFHRWREGERDQTQLLEDYAFLLDGVVELYQATLEAAHLEFGVALAETLLERFYDGAHGGFWQSPAEAQDLIFRLKEAYDGAEPSGSSVAVLALLKLGQITGREEFTEAARRSLALQAQPLNDVPQALPYLLQALDFSLTPPLRIVIAGAPGKASTRALIAAAHSVFQPNKVVLGTRGPVEEVARSLPTQEPAQAYICTGTACQEPTGEAEKVRLAAARTQPHADQGNQM